VLDNYEVGWGKPPLGTRFKKGQSGNPKGRPRGTKNLQTDLMEELQETITVREGERTVRMSKQRAMIKTVMNKSLKGDARAVMTLLRMLTRFTQPDGGSAEVDEALSVDEKELWQRLIDEVRSEQTAVPHRSDKPDAEGGES
jgi:Family of unknown function (DUF5681)